MGATRVSICSGDIGCAGGGACADAGSWAAKNAPVRSRTQTMLSACRQTTLVFVIFPPPSRTESTWRSCSTRCPGVHETEFASAPAAQAEERVWLGSVSFCHLRLLSIY